MMKLKLHLKTTKSCQLQLKISQLQLIRIIILLHLKSNAHTFAVSKCLTKK